MIPLSDIAIFFHEHSNTCVEDTSRAAIRRFSEMDMKMLVDFRILGTRNDFYSGETFYYLRKPRKRSKGTKMIYSQRVQYAKDFYKRRRAA